MNHKKRNLAAGEKRNFETGVDNEDDTAHLLCRLGWIENSPRAQAGLPQRFCIVVPWATKYHTVQPQVNSCGLKRNRLLGSTRNLWKSRI